ncbi:hypothetical protein ACFC5T_17555 [Streptomyces sp. NPDC055961]|uniref:hypothetical protein n=1 Tax=Streptomyces sp. NPDC055961 TaxID=3345666 RepID=UPI0035DDC446
MASVNETVRQLIERYPCGYPHRTEALHQILVVLGAGYEWRDGQVVSRFPDDDTCARMHRDFQYSAERVAELTEFGIEVREQFITGQCPNEDLRSRADELAQKTGKLLHGPYQPHPTLLFLDVPANAHADWAAAAAEIAAVVGPLWAAGADLELDPYERTDYVLKERDKALRRLEAVFGPEVINAAL